MLLNSEAYHACIGYFADNLALFEGVNDAAAGDLIADIVSDQVAGMLLTFFQQQRHLSHKTRLQVMAEGDKLVEDIEQILGRFWEKPATAAQAEFINEYFLLLKNSLDSQASIHS
ncbi:hypothetical protein GCM10007916_19900 [Psychromonas marina]|uniref:DUF3802 family protein n=1 Tax=Psychromonas marina TaxID=88364 RepID=A0ABQ6E128_9GAMM|nr:DUF3802 family protein [Psychromonas marina]GLS90923.1 hypothetical protein GCM10007916_19900 [Psychromonas marina]